MFLSDLVGNWYPVYNFYHLAPTHFDSENQAIKWARENLELGRAFKLVKGYYDMSDEQWITEIKEAKIQTVSIDLERIV